MVDHIPRALTRGSRSVLGVGHGEIGGKGGSWDGLWVEGVRIEAQCTTSGRIYNRLARWEEGQSSTGLLKGGKDEIICPRLATPARLCAVGLTLRSAAFSAHPVMCAPRYPPNVGEAPLRADRRRCIRSILLRVRTESYFVSEGVAPVRAWRSRGSAAVYSRAPTLSAHFVTPAIANRCSPPQQTLASMLSNARVHVAKPSRLRSANIRYLASE